MYLKTNSSTFLSIKHKEKKSVVCCFSLHIYKTTDRRTIPNASFTTAHILTKLQSPHNICASNMTKIQAVGIFLRLSLCITFLFIDSNWLKNNQLRSSLDPADLVARTTNAMCKQKPSSQSSRQGNVDVSSTSASSTTTTTSSTMPSVGACYKGEKKMVTQHRLGSTNLVEEQLFSNSNKPETDFQGNSCAMDAANSATVDPWSPAIMSDVVPDPYCPRRIAVNSEKHCLLPTDLTCGSEESLIPQSESSCDGASAAACSSLGINTELDLIRFSPASGVQIEKYNDDDGDDDDDDDNDNDIIMRRDSCVFSCDKVKFDDELSDADEYEDAIDSFNLDPFPFRGNIDVVPFSIALPSYNRADMNLSREASDLFLDVILPKSLGLPQVKSAAEISVASSSISQKSMPICRICHLPATEEDRLMSPCRCSGTMRFIHTSCLMKWLEITSNRSKRPPSCELCLYQYHRHKKFKVRQWQFPQCSRQDKVLHIIFIASLIVMLGCATATILCFKQDRGLRNSLEKSELTKSEVITLVCGVFFFVAFFVAMYVEVKSRNTIYKLCVKFVYLNQQWYIDEYDKRKDVQPVPV